MSAGTCGTCAHLGGEIEGITAEGEWGPTGYHACKLITLFRHHVDSKALAYAKDSSDYQACLCVKDEFGCKEWRAKP